MKNQLASILRIHTFSAHYANREQHGSISPINPAITENTDGTIVKACTPVNNIKVGVAVALTLCFVLLPGLQTFGYHSKQRIALQAPLLALRLPKSLTKAIARIPQIVTCKGERNGIQRRTKVSFVRTMMQAMELLRLAKRHISGQSDVEQ